LNIEGFGLLGCDDAPSRGRGLPAVQTNTGFETKLAASSFCTEAVSEMLNNQIPVSLYGIIYIPNFILLYTMFKRVV
jgi:hypothetical protein